jgi:hypothetical protein
MGSVGRLGGAFVIRAGSLYGLEHFKHRLDKLFVTNDSRNLLLPQIHKFFGEMLVWAVLHKYSYFMLIIVAENLG